MSRQLASFAPCFLVTSAVALPLCLLLSACGGDGSAMVANIPPPPPTPTPTPTPTPVTSLAVDTQTTWLPSPATRAGTYEALGTLVVTAANGGSTSRSVAPGQVTFTSDPVANSPFNYRLTAPAGFLPGGLSSVAVVGPAISWDFWPAQGHPTVVEGTWTQLLGQHLTASGQTSDGVTHTFSYDFTRGQSSATLSLGQNQNLLTKLDYDIGYSYVAMGEWSWAVVDLNGQAAGDSGRLLFVDGDRTPSTGIPVSGTATYDARTLVGWVKVPFGLVADFGQRTISTRIDQDYRYDPTGDIMDYPLAMGIHVGGSAPFSSNGMFEIPLTGTVNYSSGYDINTLLAPPSSSATGSMNGAFFGPHAEQVGGTLSLQRTSGSQLFQDAFVGRQR